MGEMDREEGREHQCDRQIRLIERITRYLRWDGIDRMTRDGMGWDGYQNKVGSRCRMQK